MPDVAANEVVTRFIFKRYFNQSTGEVSPVAFIDPKLEMSIARIDGMSEADIWRYSDARVAKKPQAPARADLKAIHIYNQSLKIVPDTDPASIHAIVVGWPTSDGEIALIAQELLAQSITVIRPPL